MAADGQDVRPESLKCAGNAFASCSRGREFIRLVGGAALVGAAHGAHAAGRARVAALQELELLDRLTERGD
jgi:hypothetical protein